MSREELRSAAASEVDRWEQALTDELLRLFDRQERVVIARLQGTKARKHTRHWEPPGDRPLEVKGIVDKARWVLEATGVVAPLVRRIYGTVFGRVAKGLDPDGESEPDEETAKQIEAAVDVRLAGVAQGVETVREEVEALIKREEDAGTPMDAIVSQVRDLYADRKPSWASRIATLCAVGSINQAGLFAAAAKGSSAKQWLSRRDSKVRDTHKVADGQVRLLDERFRLGGPKTKNPRSLLLFPGDPGPSVPLNEVINCRCTLLFSPPRAGRKADPELELKAVAPGDAPAEAGPSSEEPRQEGEPRKRAERRQAAARYVRTQAGAARFGQAIGEQIQRDDDEGLAYRRGGLKPLPAPTTARGYARMFDQVPVAQWGGADIGISHRLPDGRRIWLYGDTLSQNNGFVHSTAITQTGGRLHVSRGGKQLIPNGGKDPADPSRELISWIDGVRQGPTKDTVIVSTMEMSVGAEGPWDFRKTREGQSREAVVRVEDDGDLRFVEWKGWHPTPTENNPHLTDDFETVGPHHFSYGTVVHDIRLEDGAQLTTRSQNYDDDFANHLNADGSLRYKDWRPIFGKTRERKADDVLMETKAKVRTVGGAQHYGQAIGTTIRRDLLGPIGTLGEVEIAGRDKAVRAMVKQQKPGLDQTGTQVAVLRDYKGRVGAYVVWDKSSGEVLEVSVHPKLRGKRIGDQMLDIITAYDPKVQRPKRGGSSSPAAAPAAPAAPRTPRDQVRDLSQPGDVPGPSGDFDADVERIERLQKAYLRDRKDTQSMFAGGGGVWSRDREKQQKAIVDHFVNKPGVKADRQLLVLGGMPGAGKTTTLNSQVGQLALGVNLDEYVTVNSDEVKAEMIARGMVPDYPGLSPEESLSMIQAESYEIAQAVMRQAATKGLNFAYDATLRTSGQLGAPEAAIARHAPPGYQTTMVLIDVPMQTAMDRARARYEAGDRYVPLGFIGGMKSHDKRFKSAPEQNFEGFKSRVDRWVVFDNSGAGPVLVDQGGKKGRTASTPVPAGTTPTPTPEAPVEVDAYETPLEQRERLEGELKARTESRVDSLTAKAGKHPKKHARTTVNGLTVGVELASGSPVYTVTGHNGQDTQYSTRDEAVTALMRRRPASGVLMRSPSGRILLAKRADRMSGGGFWAAPGGVIEEGEDEFSGAAREVYEELGINLAGKPMRLAATERSDSGRRDYTSFVVDIDEEPEPVFDPAETETDDAQWFTPEQALALPLLPALQAQIAQLITVPKGTQDIQPALDPTAPSGASKVDPRVPAAPEGAEVWLNRSGKVIYVLPDGSLEVYKPDGKPSRTTASADRLRGGYGDWKQVGGPVAPKPEKRPRRAATAAPTPAAAPAAAPTAVALGGRPDGLPAALPDPPAGARVFVHPQGKTVYVLADGSLAVYKPDGKRGTTSATAAKLLAGYGGWSELGADTGTALPATPAPAAKVAAAAAPPLVAAPKAPLDVSAGAPAPSGSLPVSPMDFNEAPLSDVPKYIADPNYVFQQKVDGIRGVLVIEPGQKPWFASKKGDRLVSSTAAQVTTPLLAKLPPTPPGSPAYRVEGEILNGKFHVFDMVVVGQESTDYETRSTMADAWVQAVSPSLPQVESLPTARTAAEKQALWDKVLASGAEGVMMKRRDAGYQGGQRVSHTLKAKVTSTADVVVLERNRGGKDNAVFGMLVNGKVTEIGTVSTGGKDKALGQINVGDVVEVEYLWASPGGTLTQPRIVRKRKDKTPNDATAIDQLRFVDKAILSLAAKAARLQLEFQIERARHAVGS